MRWANRWVALAAAGWIFLAAPDATVAQVAGRVIDAASGAPIADAEVAFEGVASSRVLTDQSGLFRLPAGPGPTSGSAILVRRLGYAAARVAFPGPALELLVRLAPLPVALDAIVVTAARREQRLADAVVTTELIGRDEIERSGAADLAGVLATQTGIQIEGGIPAGAGVMLQGLGAQRVLVLLDGQPVSGRVNGNFDLSRLPASMVERIEVVKGPQSTLYGSDAMGGVINIVTRRSASAAGIQAATTAGSNGRREISAGGAGRMAALGWVADAGYRTSDLAPGVAGEAGTLARRAHFAPRLEWRASPNWTLEVAALVVGERQRYRTGQLYNFSDNTQFNGRMAAAYRTAALSVAPVVSWSRFDHLSRRSTGPAPASDSGAVDVQDLVQLEVPASFSAGRAIVDAGLLLRRDAIRAERVPGGTRAMHSAEPWGQVTLVVGQLNVTPGARLSASERWGTVVTPRVAALWRPRPAVAVRAAFGRGYRAPDFKELYLEFANPSAGYAVRGNPDLRPETSTNLSASIEWAAARWTARATGFANRYRNFIESTEQDATGTFSYGNIARGSTSGLEFESGVALGALQLDAAWSWLVARDDSAGGPLLGRPGHSFRLGASAARGFIRGGASLRLTGRTPLARDSTGNISRERDSFVRLDLRGAAALSRGLELTTGIDNVLDRSMGSDWPGFTGRQLYVGLRFEMARR